MKKLSILLALVAYLYAQGVSAESITLDKTTVLVPQGWSVADEDLKFKKDTTAELNERGEVVSAVLNKATYLRPTGWRSLINDYCYVETTDMFFPRFFHPWGMRYGAPFPTYGHIRYAGDRLVKFAADGTVLKGVIDEKVTLALSKDSYGFVDFKSGTILSFDENGHVTHGTLSSDTYLRPIGWQAHPSNNKLAGFIEFKGGKAIDFNDNGEVISGTLKESTTWHDLDGSEITLPAKATVHFTDKGAEIIQPEKEK